MLQSVHRSACAEGIAGTFRTGWVPLAKLAVLILSENRFQKLTNGVYTIVGEQVDPPMSDDQVCQAINRVVKHAWENRNMKIWRYYFPEGTPGHAECPSNKEFLIAIVDFVELCEAWFEVTAVRGMTELGARYIDIEESSDGVNWYVVKTYDRSDYSNLIKYNTSNHTSYVTFNEMQPGYQYRMYVSLFAKDSNGNTASSGKYGYFVN